MGVVLDDLEYIGLKIICLVRAGKLDKFKCSGCTTDMQKERNCDSIGEESVHYEDSIGEFYSCPMNFIPQSVTQFLRQYDHYEKYPNSAPSYGERNPRYWEALMFYENFKANLEAGIKEPKESEEDKMAKMKKLFNKG